MSGYDDILGLSRPRSRRPPMPMADRAAQFAPFAALSGHEAAVAFAWRISSPTGGRKGGPTEATRGGLRA